MRITSKGQVTIPERIRREAGLLPGTEVEFVTKDGEVILKPQREGKASKREREMHEHLAKWRGSAARGWTTERVMELTRGDD
jgi:AbrB family looped-hinge helix DNA binding protein